MILLFMLFYFQVEEILFIFVGSLRNYDCFVCFHNLSVAGSVTLGTLLTENCSWPMA